MTATFRPSVTRARTSAVATTVLPTWVSVPATKIPRAGGLGGFRPISHRRSVLLVFDLSSFVLARAQRRIQRRQHDEREQGRGDQATDHHGRDWSLRFRADV